jgi:hypothetical protein
MDEDYSFPVMDGGINMCSKEMRRAVTRKELARLKKEQSLRDADDSL